MCLLDESLDALGQVGYRAFVHAGGGRPHKALATRGHRAATRLAYPAAQAAAAAGLVGRTAAAGLVTAAEEMLLADTAVGCAAPRARGKNRRAAQAARAGLRRVR